MSGTIPPRGAITRRNFVVGAGIAGGGLLIGAGAITAYLDHVAAYKLPAGDGEASLGAWLKIANDGMIEVVVPHQEMGQGIYSLAILLTAEMMRMPIDGVRAVQAPIHAYFANPILILDGLPFDEHIETISRSATE